MKLTAHGAQGRRPTKRSFSRDDRLARDGTRCCRHPPPPVSPIMILFILTQYGGEQEVRLKAVGRLDDASGP